jgi:hypothetical protein
MVRPPYDDPLFRAVHGFAPLHIRFTLRHTNGTVHIFTIEADRDAYAAAMAPGTVATIDTLYIPEQHTSHVSAMTDKS